MKKLGVVLLLVSMFFSNNLYSQGDMSKNGFFVASVVQENGNNIVLVHKFMTKELIRKLPVQGSTSIDEVKLSYSGEYLYIKQGSRFSIYNVLQGNLITSISNVQQIVFPNAGNYFLVLKANSLVKYDVNTGSGSMTYYYPRNKNLIEIVISPNGTFFAAKSVDKIFIYEINTSTVKKQLPGVDVKFSADGNSLTILADLDSKIRVQTIELPSLYQKRTYTSDVLFRNINPGGEVFPTRSSLSKTGQFVAIYTAFNVKVEIYVFNTTTGDRIWTINNFSNTSNELFPQFWPKDNMLVGSGDQLMAGEYNLSTMQTKALGLRIDDFTTSPALTLDNQRANRIMSPDLHYVIIQDGNNLMIRDSRVPNKKTTYTDIEFLSFSPDSKYMFVKKDNTVNAVVLQQITAGLQTNSPARLYAFDNVLSIAEPEDLITNDAPPPPGYAYFYVNNTKEIVKVDTSKLHYTFRSMNIDGNHVELQVNLVDANGNTFLGATDASWKYIWCNLLVQNPNGTVGQVNDFTVEEVVEDEPTAYALVLDHSGSMGPRRANQLQFGALNLIKNKRTTDAFLVIKYDDKVKVERGLTKDLGLLQRSLNNSGLAGYGGSTALIDAGYMAALKLSKATDYPKKSIILFTDGYENASIYSKFDLLDLAIKNDIEINVVGFGDQINEQYLKSLAYNTGGIYVHLFNTDELKGVFQDIDFKRRHYYSVKFQTQQQGKHVAFLQLCQDLSTHDSVVIPFDNTAQQQQLDQRNPMPDLQRRDIKLTQFNQKKIPINPVMKPVTDRRTTTDFAGIDFPNILFKTASAQIINSNQDGIDNIVAFMRKYPNVFLQIHGHTDNEGDPSVNMQLSKDRSMAAKKLIVDAGIAPGRIITMGFGDTKPIAPNTTDDGKRKNRRIEFHIFVQ